MGVPQLHKLKQKDDVPQLQASVDSLQQHQMQRGASCSVIQPISQGNVRERYQVR